MRVLFFFFGKVYYKVRVNNDRFMPPFNDNYINIPKWLQESIIQSLINLLSLEFS